MFGKKVTGKKDKVVLEPLNISEPEAYDPLTGARATTQIYRVVGVEGDPVLEYPGFKCSQVSKMRIVSGFEAEWLRHQGVEVVGLAG